MTKQEAIDFVRMFIDESGVEFVGTLVDAQSDVKRALQEASYDKVREWWARGDKEALRPFWKQETYTGASPYSFASYAVQPMFIETVQVRVGSDVRYPAKQTTLELWTQWQAANPLMGARVGSAEYAYKEGQIFFVGDGIVVSYYLKPDIDWTNLALELFNPPYVATSGAAWTHAQICERAAQILMSRQPLDEDRVPLGVIYDIERLMSQQAERGAA